MSSAHKFIFNFFLILSVAVSVLHGATLLPHTHPIHLFLSRVSIKQVDYIKSKSSHMAEQNNAAASSSDSGLPFVFPTENDTNCLQLEEQVE